jgi:hypothetical protein
VVLPPQGEIVVLQALRALGAAREIEPVLSLHALGGAMAYGKAFIIVMMSGETDPQMRMELVRQFEEIFDIPFEAFLFKGDVIYVIFTCYPWTLAQVIEAGGYIATTFPTVLGIGAAM